MSRGPLIVLIALIALIGAFVTFYLVLSREQNGREERTPASASLKRGDAIFTDGEHGFSIFYPEKDQVDYSFATFYHLPANWRVDAAPDATGTPIIAIVGYRTSSEHSYPRYFDAEVRIGASKDPKEVSRCETANADSAEQALPDVSLGGTVFKAFSFESAGMMQYLKGVSYRVVHDGTCIDVEKLETGASYHDDPASAADVPQATLDQAYQDLDAIVQTFSFARS